MMRALEHFRFCPRCGQTPLRMGDGKSVSCPACGFLLFMNVASAVGAIIPRADGRILLIRRAKDPRKGKLGAPGGFMDPGESVEVALRREVMEEVNLEITSMRYLYSSPNAYEFREITYPTADLFFVCEAKTFDTLAMPDGEAASLEFVDPLKIDKSDIAFPSLFEAIQLYLRERNQA